MNNNMIKTALFISLLTAALVISLSFCRSNKEFYDTYNSKINLDWEGVYTGTIPSASGPGINVRLKLNRNQIFELNYEFLDRPNNPINRAGSFQWDNTGSIIKIDIIDAPLYYKVAENKLIQLDMNGKLISGKLADNYVLEKQR